MSFVVISSAPAAGPVAAESLWYFHCCPESEEHRSEHAASGDRIVPLIGVAAYVALV